MKSSRNRSRSKGNRNRSVGNIVNRVFDSSGPEGKVRGTPQQIIDKYNQLTRDAQLANDRVAAENFQQHAEHYLRMLSEAQREQEARREQQNQQQSGQKGDGDDRQRNSNSRGGGDKRQENGAEAAQDKPQSGEDTPRAKDSKESSDAGFGAVIDPGEGGQDSGLVETPESAPKPKRPRTRRKKPEDAASTPQDAPDAAAPQATEQGGATGDDDGSDGSSRTAAE